MFSDPLILYEILRGLRSLGPGLLSLQGSELRGTVLLGAARLWKELPGEICSDKRSINYLLWQNNSPHSKYIQLRLTLNREESHK